VPNHQFLRSRGGRCGGIRVHVEDTASAFRPQRCASTPQTTSCSGW
jgi:hypothetical protein